MGFSFLTAIGGRPAPARSAKKSKKRSRLPAGAPETPLTEALATRPRPLVDVRKKLIVIFSPKAACTNVVIWFLNHLGHLSAAQDYARFPHPYRVQVYYRSNIYRKAFSTDLSRF